MIFNFSCWFMLVLVVGIGWLLFSMEFVRPRSLSYYSYELRASNRFPCQVNWIPGLLFLAAILSPIFYEFPNWPSSYVVTFDSQGNTTSHRFGAFCWEFKHNFVNVPLRSVHLEANLNVPNETCRARTLHYLVAVKITDPTVFFKSYGNHQAKWAYLFGDEYGWDKLEALPLMEAAHSVEQQIKLTLAKYLLAFHNNPPKNMPWASFNDPFNFVQQSLFKTCMESALNPQLAKAGLRVEVIQFILE